MPRRACHCRRPVVPGAAWVRRTGARMTPKAVRPIPASRAWVLAGAISAGEKTRRCGGFLLGRPVEFEDSRSTPQGRPALFRSGNRGSNRRHAGADVFFRRFGRKGPCDRRSPGMPGTFSPRLACRRHARSTGTLAGRQLPRRGVQGADNAWLRRSPGRRLPGPSQAWTGPPGRSSWCVPRIDLSMNRVLPRPAKI